MKKNIVLSLGLVGATLMPIAAVISCSKSEESNKPSEEINNHILSFTLSPEDLKLKNIEGMRMSQLRKLKNYPFTVVQQNQLISNSNNTYDVQGKTYRDILKSIPNIKIENNNVLDAFALKMLIKDSDELLLSGMGLMQESEITEGNFKKIYDAAEKIYAEMGMPNKASLTLDTFFKGQFGADAVKDGWGFEDYFKKLLDGVKDIKTKEDVAYQSPYSWKTISAYLPNNHIYLYANDKKITDFDEKVSGKKINLTIKIDE